jgi:hypothetical protein
VKNLVKTSKNMKKYSAIIAAIAASVLSFTAQANPLPQLQGSIAYNGTYVADGTGVGDLTGATKLTSMTGNVEQGTGYSSGSFTVLGTAAINFNTPVSLLYPSSYPSGILLFSVNGPGSTLWEFFTTGTTYSSGLIGYGTTAVEQLTGNGYVEEFNSSSNLIAGGAGDTGTWGISLNASGASLQFSGSTAVPDGGLTVALLGGALVALQAFRRKLLK